MKKSRNNQARKRIVMAITTMVILGLGAILWPKPVGLPPSLSVDLLEYTNRTGPYALLAITNRSASAITLDGTCLVRYSLTQAPTPRSVTSVEPNQFNRTRLFPNEGFVQDVFVFPANQGEWQFECYAAYSSSWLEIKRAAESRLRKHFQFKKFQLTADAWHEFNTSWLTCPP